MNESIGFHLDEHISPAIAGGLRQRGIIVTTAGGEGLLGAMDIVHLAFALSRKSVMVTQDQDFCGCTRRASRTLELPTAS